METNFSSLLTEHSRLSLAEVLHLFGFSRSTLFARIKAGKFPKPIQVIGRNFWVAKEILDLLLYEENNRA